MPAPLSRRRFLASGALLAAGAAWSPIFRVRRAGASAACPSPTDFPSHIELYRQAFRNWSGEVAVDDVWTCAPRSAPEVVEIANWAVERGYRVRPRGMMHGWAPLTLASGGSCPSNVVLVDTTQHLHQMSVRPGTPPTVTVQTGATMDALLGFLEAAGYGMTATPAPGDVTVGGVLAIDGHGTAVPALGEQRRPGTTFGSLSNLVLSATAVVWDARTRRYELRTIDRSDRASAPLLTCLGRTFLTEVTLQVGVDQNLRCQSFVDIPATELFAAPGDLTGRTFTSFLDSAGRVEAIWYPFTDNPWVKVWSVAPRKPLTSREVTSPYNYPFSDNIPDDVVTLSTELVRGNGASTPAFGASMYGVTVAGLAATASFDLWGKSKNTLLYIRPSTMRVTANGYAVVTSRSQVQQVLHEFVTAHLDRVEAFRARGLYPANMPVEIRVTGLDTPSDVDTATPVVPALSAIAPRSDHPEWDVAVWFDVLSLPGTPGANEFYRETEQWMYATFAGDLAAVRAEWSKGWAYGRDGAWTDREVIGQRIPDSFPAGGRSPGWDDAVRMLDAFDPHGVFASPLLDALVGHAEGAER